MSSFSRDVYLGKTILVRKHSSNGVECDLIRNESNPVIPFLSKTNIGYGDDKNNDNAVVDVDDVCHYNEMLHAFKFCIAYLLLTNRRYKTNNASWGSNDNPGGMDDPIININIDNYVMLDYEEGRRNYDNCPNNYRHLKKKNSCLHIQLHNDDGTMNYIELYMKCHIEAIG